VIHQEGGGYSGGGHGGYSGGGHQEVKTVKVIHEEGHGGGFSGHGHGHGGHEVPLEKEM